MTLYTLIKYYEIKTVTLNIILFSWVLYIKFLSLYVTLNHFCFLKATHFFLLHFTSFLSMLAFFELDAEDTIHPTYSTSEPLSPIQMHDISIIGWECSMWTLRKEDCEVHFVFMSSPLEKDKLKDELQKAQEVRSKTHYTNRMQVWLGLYGWYQRQPKVSKYKYSTHLTYQSQSRGGKILTEKVSAMSKILFFYVHVSMKKMHVPCMTYLFPSLVLNLNI